MIMIIKSIDIRNFKSFENITILLNSKTNIIIGENNIGKSSLFEAILLWKKCFDSIIRPNRIDFYKNDQVGRYIPFNDLRFIRIINDTDLFYSVPNECRITLNIECDDQEFNLTFEISKPKAIKNSYLRYRTLNHKDFEKFAATLKLKKIKLPDAIFVYQAKPVANILDMEPFMNKGQILRKISLGKSGEVLRNKIIRHDDEGINKISSQVSKVLGHNVKFHYINKANAISDEYIDIKTEVDDKTYDLHLQGSGLLQVTEIFSTIEFMSNKSVNLLLIDEPDSHIHVKLQKKLLNEIKKISNIQTFIISHNDNFVSEANNGELFYLDRTAKTNHLLNPLSLSDYDIVKRELGGIIVALDKLNKSDKICFTEGDDDIDYILKLKAKYDEISDEKPASDPLFFYLRGKGDLVRKIEYYKRLLPQIVKDKKYMLIYDKDYCTIAKSNEYENVLKRKMGVDSQVFRHNGYCIESTLFSEQDILIKLLVTLSNVNIEDVKNFVTSYYEKMKEDLLRVDSERHRIMNERFKGQKNTERPELKDVEFIDFLNCALNGDNYQYVFNKNMIKEFIVDFDNTFTTNTLNKTDDDSVEFYASTLYNSYISNITSLEDFLIDSKNILHQLFGYV